MDDQERLKVIQHRMVPRIVTEYIYPPIPTRNFDWQAIDDNTYDGPGSKIGYGPTKQDAINDLMEQMYG